MKKIIILTMLVFISNSNFAQNKNICGELQYEQVKNFGRVGIENYVMKFNNESSYSEEIDIELSDNSNEVIDEENEMGSTDRTNVTVIGRKNKTSKFFYNNKDGFYFRDNFLDETLLVKENSFNWNWELHQETKQIGNFSCQKATIKFRGRNYIAWFTNDIPVPFGPWKFQGLSGLILEVYDTDKVFHITTSKIKVNENVDCVIDVNKLEDAMTITTYLDRKNEMLGKLFSKANSRLPKGLKPAKFDKNCKDCPKGLEIFDEEN